MDALFTFFFSLFFSRRLVDVWAFYNRGVAFTSSGETQMVSTLHADTLLAVIAADEKTEWSPPVLGGASVCV